MPGYVGLFRFTQQGIAGIKDLPQRVEAAKGLAEKLGIRVVGVWLTMGRYDMVVIGDAPDDKAVATFALALGQVGNVTTETLRALSEEEMAEVIGRLP